jgi:hypothetical protein
VKIQANYNKVPVDELFERGKLSLTLSKFEGLVRKNEVKETLHSPYLISIVGNCKKKMMIIMRFVVVHKKTTTT